LARAGRLALLEEVPGVDEVGAGVVGMLVHLTLQRRPAGLVRLVAARLARTRLARARLGIAGDRLALMAFPGRGGQRQRGDDHEGQYRTAGEELASSRAGRRRRTGVAPFVDRT